MVDLREVTPDPAATTLLDEAAARRLVAIPLAVTGDAIVVVVAVAVPIDIGHRAARRAGPSGRVKVAPHSDILRVIGSSYRALTGVGSQVQAFEAQQAQRAEPRRPRARTGSAVNDDAPVVQVVQLIITQALRDRASDIHIEPQADRRPGAVPHRRRAARRARPAGGDGSGRGEPLKILANMNIVERRRAQDGQISMEIDGRGVDIRVATTGVIEGEKVVHAAAGQEPPALPARPARHAGRT